MLQGNKLAPYQLLNCLNHVQRTIDFTKEWSFQNKNTRDKRYSAVTITGADCADDLVHLANILAVAEFYSTVWDKQQVAFASSCTYIKQS